MMTINMRWGKSSPPHKEIDMEAFKGTIEVGISRIRAITTSTATSKQDDHELVIRFVGTESECNYVNKLIWSGKLRKK